MSKIKENASYLCKVCSPIRTHGKRYEVDEEIVLPQSEIDTFNRNFKIKKEAKGDIKVYIIVVEKVGNTEFTEVIQYEKMGLKQLRNRNRKELNEYALDIGMDGKAVDLAPNIPTLVDNIILHRDGG